MTTNVAPFFGWKHLPASLQRVSKPIGVLAEQLENMLPASSEKSFGMRKLLEAKDCFVRAGLDLPPMFEPAPELEITTLSDPVTRTTADAITAEIKLRQATACENDKPVEGLGDYTISVTKDGLVAGMTLSAEPAIKWDCYEGTKRVMAHPMTRGAYNAYRNWTMPANENGDDEGYLVEYLEGGASNHDKHEGYISWSPKSVFEHSYKVVVPTSFEERVKQEFAELQEKTIKLREFLADFDKVIDLPPLQQTLLARQYDAMSCYLDTLAARIAAFN